MNKKALEIINALGFGIENDKELFERLNDGVLYGKTCNLNIEYEWDYNFNTDDYNGRRITFIEKEPVIVREIIFERDE